MGMDQISSYITLGILGAIGILFLFGFLRGLRKGFYKSLMDIGFVVLCLIVSILIAKSITNTLTDIAGLTDILMSVKGSVPDLAPTVDSALEMIEQFGDNPEMINVLLALPAALITPIVFIPIYILLGILIKIPKLIIERVVVGKNGGPNYRGGSRLLGGLVGGIRNALFIVVILVPIVGYAFLAGDVVKTIDSVSLDGGAVGVNTEAEKNEGGTVLLGAETSATIGMADIGQILDNPAMKGIYNFGGKLVFNSLTTKTVEGVKIDASKEVNTFAELYANFTPFLNESPENYGDEQKQGINNIKVMLNDSEFLTFVVSEGLSFVAEKWNNGEAAFGIEKIEVGEDIQPVFDGILETLSTTDSENIKGDIETISNLISTCIDDGVFKELGKEEPDFISLIKKESFVTNLLVEIYKNERTRPIIGYAMDMVVDLLSDSLATEGTNITKPDSVNMGNISEADIRNDAKIISSVVDKFIKFMESTENLDSSDPNAFILNADLGSLGSAIDSLRESALLGNTCEYLIKVMLNSDMVKDLGFVNDDLVAKLSDKSFKIENTLVSAQKLAVMALNFSGDGITEDNFEDAIKFMISEMTPETAETIKSAISEDTLKDFGISEEQAGAVSSTIGSIVDSMANATGDMTEEEIKKETEAISTLVNTVMGAVSSDSGSEDISNIFGGEEDSKTGITAESFVDTVVSSQVISSAIVGATKDENGEKVEDPYGFADTLTEDDKAIAEDTIKEYFDNNKSGDETDEALKETLGAVAGILGMDSSAWFN